MAIAQTAAQQLFQELVDNKNLYQFLCDKVDHEVPQTECEWLDYKCCLENERKLPDHKIKEIWAKALSGFSNNAGGVVIWGLDCRKNKNKNNLDEVIRLSLCESPDEVKEILLKAIKDIVEPPVVGVDVKAIKGSDGKGFVVCYIPEGSQKPYRTKPDNQFYLRIGESSLPMPYSVIRSLFYRKSFAKCDLILKPHKGKYNDSIKNEYQIVVDLENKGMITIKNAILNLNCNSSVRVTPSGKTQVLEYSPGFTVSSDYIYHPFYKSHFCHSYITPAAKDHDGMTSYPLVDLNIDVKLFLEDHPPLIGKGVVTVSDINSSAEVRISLVPLSESQI